MKKKGKIEVEVTKIEVDERYFTVYYKFSINGKKPKSAEYNSDYESWTQKEFREELQSGYAVEIALREAVESL